MDRYLDTRSESSPPALVVGTMNFGKRTAEPEAHRIVHGALERGLNFFDTANAYVQGESERILGRALGNRRGQARIATKVGFGASMANPEGLAPERIASALDESLARLGTDRVELYYFHKPDHSRELAPSLRAMEKLIASGKVGAFGASNFASWQLLEMAHLGLNPPGSRFEKNSLYQQRYLSDRFFDLAEAFGRLAAEAGRTPVELAYQWVAARPGVDSILLGPASVEQLDAAVDAVDKTLPKEVIDRADELYRAFQGTDASYAR